MSKKTSPLFFFIVLFAAAALAQNPGGTEDGDTIGGIIDAEQIILEDAPSEEESPAPLEPPYVDAENAELSGTGEKTVEAVKKPAPLPEAPAAEDGKGRYRKKYIHHPNAKKGLFKITKDGDYLYKVTPSEKKSTASLRIGVFSAPDFVNGDNGASYNDIYGGNDLIFLFDYEWPLAGVLPGLSFKLGSGLLYAKGQGRLEQTGEAALEEFSFFMFPNSVSLAYKFRYSDRQWFYPYIEGGGGAFVFTERRDDNEPPLGRWGAAFNLHAVGGVALSVSALSRDKALRLDADYGINEVWFTLDVRQILGFGNFDMTSTLINGGFTVEF